MRSTQTKNVRRVVTLAVAAALTTLASIPPAVAQTAPPPAVAQPAPQTTAPPSQPGAAKPAPAGTAKPVAPTGVAPPPGYVIGPDDVLAVIFWREKDLSADEVIVRPDGKITLPILNDIHAAGLTPDQLRDKVAEVAGRYVQDPSATVVVRAINSRRVFITGQVNKAGPYALNAPMTVLQLIATAGGLAEWAKGDNVVVMRTEGGRTQAFKFNYREVIKGKKLEQNIELRPGDTVVVP